MSLSELYETTHPDEHTETSFGLPRSPRHIFSPSQSPFQPPTFSNPFILNVAFVFIRSLANGSAPRSNTSLVKPSRVGPSESYRFHIFSWTLSSNLNVRFINSRCICISIGRNTGPSSHPVKELYPRSCPRDAPPACPSVFYRRLKRRLGGEGGSSDHRAALSSRQKGGRGQAVRGYKVGTKSRAGPFALSTSSSSDHGHGKRTHF